MTEMPHDPTEELAQSIEIDGAMVPAVLAKLFGSQLDTLAEAKEPKENLHYYKNFNEFMMHMLLVGVMHSFPESDIEDAIEIATIVADSLRLPNARPSWKQAALSIERFGLNQTMVRVSMELTRGMYRVKG